MANHTRYSGEERDILLSLMFAELGTTKKDIDAIHNAAQKVVPILNEEFHNDRTVLAVQTQWYDHIRTKKPKKEEPKPEPKVEATQENVNHSGMILNVNVSLTYGHSPEENGMIERLLKAYL